LIRFLSLNGVQILRDAGLRDGRLHDARHAAATVLLILQVHERAAMGVMGWASSSMATRYQHVTDPIRAEIAKKVGGLIWKPADSPPAEPASGPAGEQEGQAEAA
jgi:integrase